MKRRHHCFLFVTINHIPNKKKRDSKEKEPNGVSYLSVRNARIKETPRKDKGHLGWKHKKGKNKMGYGYPHNPSTNPSLFNKVAKQSLMRRSFLKQIFMSPHRHRHYHTPIHLFPVLTVAPNLLNNKIIPR